MTVKVNDSVWKKLQSTVKGMGKIQVRIGVFSAEPHGGDDSLTLVQLMAVHEFGSDKAGIPERAPIRKTFLMKKSEYKKMVGKLAKMVISGSMTVANASEILGLWGASEVKTTIINGLSPPNTARTIARKGSSTPLIDTGQLLNSITFEVVG